MKAELDQALREERRRALRALLRRPLLSADGPHEGELLLVRRHADDLRDWLARHPGWGLQVDSETARLRKLPGSLDDGSRPARDPKSGTPFNRRRYVLLCLALAALEKTDRQTALGELAQRIVELAADPQLEAAGIVFDLKSHDQRRDLVHVVRTLCDYQVLRRVDGDEELYLRRNQDVLYTIRRVTLAAMLNVRRGPSTVRADDFEERLATIVEEPLPQSDEARLRRLRTRLTRRLLDDPVLEYDSLDEDELAYLQSQRHHLCERIHEQTGLIPEARREGLAMVDDRGDLCDQKMPEKGTDGHLTLLLAEFLAAQAREGVPTVGWATLESHVAELIARHRKLWRRSVGERGAERVLCRDAVERLEALALVRTTEDGVEPRPAIGRYAVAEVRIQGTDTGVQQSLLTSRPPFS